ncbi:Na(+)-translocating NADH-quinone reductase subunit B [Bacteroidia bacterium]|nr:Na(+)-translocating NADH-quinone reductase subunit B [Bacteroidia bacterium]
MKFLRNYLDKIKPNFEKGGKLEMFHSVFDGFETFLFVPDKTSKSGVHIHDAVDSKRTMTFVIIALIPALLFGMYNTGYQHYLAIGQNPGFWGAFLFGFLAVFPIVVVSYVVGLGIEFVVAQWKGHEIQEGFLVSGMLIPLIVPVDTPLWMIAVATAFAVIFAKEVFGGTGYNIWNVALVTRAFLFFAYPSKMSGDQVFVRTDSVLGIGSGQVVDAFSGATPLGQITAAASGPVQVTDVLGNPLSLWELFLGLIPGSIGETSKLAIIIGAVFLLITGVASWKTMLSVFLGGLITALMFNIIGTTPGMLVKPYEHIMLGGFAFGAVFMATDPVTSPRTQTGKYIFGFLIGAFAITVRVLNPGYPEGMMLAILFMNSFAPLIDYCVVEGNIKRRLKRVVRENCTNKINCDKQL